MPSEIKISPGTSGWTVYAVVINAAAQFWNTSGTPAFESENDSNWPVYAVALTEKGTTGLYVGSFPAGIDTAAVYYLQFRQQIGEAPALSDPFLGSGSIKWTGAAEAFSIASSAASATNIGMNNTNLNANVIQWGSGAVPATSQTGVPLVDPHYWGGTAFPSTATAGIPDVNLKNISNSVVSATSAQIGTNVVNIGGHAATLDANNLLSVGVSDWNGASVATSPPQMDLINAPNATALAAIGLSVLMVPSGVESGFTLQESARGWNSVLLGLNTGNVFRDLNNSKNRVSATVDANSDRTAIVLNLT